MDFLWIKTKKLVFFTKEGFLFSWVHCIKAKYKNTILNIIIITQRYTYS
jgi:hypothetical protein